MNHVRPFNKTPASKEFVMGAIIGWIVFGFVVGVIARFFLPGPDPMGLIVTTLLGVAGSFVGGYLGSLIHGGPIDASQPAGWLGSIAGAIILLGVFHFVRRRSAP
jgi:uncharacterized membrane protein YeaQ/YmgE (transglycosylase-associated protein family)